MERPLLLDRGLLEELHQVCPVRLPPIIINEIHAFQLDSLAFVAVPADSAETLMSLTFVVKGLGDDERDADNRQRDHPALWQV